MKTNNRPSLEERKEMYRIASKAFGEDTSSTDWGLCNFFISRFNLDIYTKLSMILPELGMQDPDEHYTHVYSSMYDDEKKSHMNFWWDPADKAVRIKALDNAIRIAS